LATDRILDGRAIKIVPTSPRPTLREDVAPAPQQIAEQPDLLDLRERLLDLESRAQCLNEFSSTSTQRWSSATGRHVRL
jgi:hypothetical protein